MSDSTLHPAHPDVELLAEHAEELLTPEQSAELTDHLAACPECRETYDALAELTALLGDEPSPGPMPEDVAARIDAALAAERENAPAEGVTEAADADDGDGVGAGAGAAVGAADGGDPNRARRRPAGDRPGGRPGDNRPRNHSPRSTRIRRVLATLAVFVAAGGIAVAVSRGGDLDSGGESSSASVAGGSSVTAPSPSALATPVYNFTQANLTTEVQRLASDSARRPALGRTAGTVPSASTPPTAAPSGPPSATATSPSGVGAMVSPNGGPESPAASPTQPTAPLCVLNATKQTQPPAVQGLGNYLDVEVFALLYPGHADPAHTWDVYLVQNSCSAPLVLLHQTVPRG